MRAHIRAGPRCHCSSTAFRRLGRQPRPAACASRTRECVLPVTSRSCAGAMGVSGARPLRPCIRANSRPPLRRCDSQKRDAFHLRVHVKPCMNASRGVCVQRGDEAVELRDRLQRDGEVQVRHCLGHGGGRAMLSLVVRRVRILRCRLLVSSMFARKTRSSWVGMASAFVPSFVFEAARWPCRRQSRGSGTGPFPAPAGKHTHTHRKSVMIAVRVPRVLGRDIAAKSGAHPAQAFVASRRVAKGRCLRTCHCCIGLAWLRT